MGPGPRMSDDIDAVFRALGDPTRRRILDIIKARPGITMHEISEHFAISRFGVRKHILVLEEANLIVHRWRRPIKKFYLNAIPIQMIYDRWISEYSQTWAQSLTALKYELERKTMNEEQKQIYVVYIRCSPDELWEALVSPERTEQYYLGLRLSGDLRVGGTIVYSAPDTGERRVSGRIMEFVVGKKITHTFLATVPDVPAAPESLVTYEIEPMGETVKLTVTHEKLEHPGIFQATAQGWPIILNGLKSLIETGRPLKFG